jgi:hypothetical protein
MQMKLEIPKALRLREERICTALRQAAAMGGETGEAAGLLEAILLPHLAKERVDLLQPLGLLRQIARGEVTSEMAEVLPQIDQLKKDLRDLRVEHATILSAMKHFVAAAREEAKWEETRFAERLLFRAWLDESVFTPLAILIGEYLQLRLNRREHPASAVAPSSRLPAKLELPEALQLSHKQLSAALGKISRCSGRTTAVADTIAQTLEPHIEREEEKVLRVLGLLAPLAAGQFDQKWLDNLSEWGDLETKESELHLEHRTLVRAGEELLAIAREEDAREVLDFSERLLLRIRLDEEVFYPAALLIRNYLRMRVGKDYLQRPSSDLR